MRNLKLKAIVFTALFAALSCAATAAIRIPTPGTGGYIHLGDAVVILSGIVLGPLWGALAAGLGSALADVLGGYFFFAPITFVIKAIVALVAGILCRAVRSKRRLNSRLLPAVFGGIADVILVAGGYFLFEIPMYGLPAALLSIPANLIQGVSGLVIAVILCPILLRIPDIYGLSDELRRTDPGGAA